MQEQSTTAAKHTPGPWATERFGKGPRYHINAPATLDLAACHLVADVYGLANARLIAAAPTLLAALEAEHEALGCETDVTGQPCGTCDLIAAAKGEPS